MLVISQMCWALVISTNQRIRSQHVYVSSCFTPTASKLRAKNSVPTEWQSKTTSFGHDLQQKRCFLLNLYKKITFDVCSSP